MNIEAGISIGIVTAILAGMSQAAQPPAARPSEDRVLLCYATKSAATTGTSKLFKASAVSRYIDKGNCRVPDGGPQAGSPCTRTDFDGDDVCGSDGMTCGDGHGPGGIDNPCACGESVVTAEPEYGDEAITVTTDWLASRLLM